MKKLVYSLIISIATLFCVQLQAQEQPDVLGKICYTGEYTTLPNVERPKMQVVFLLDATGSMSGLIDAAKEKIWSIVSSLTQTEPTPQIELGMVFYRDRGDYFITRIVPMGTPMDDLYEVLMAMTASGGGDGPESVNQALNEAVVRMKWDNLPQTYRAIFLVGDYPPHMDYRNDIKYPNSCKIATQKGIVVNTILMGNEPTAKRIWREIAQMTNGTFLIADMNVNDIKVDSPYDIQINKLQFELDNTRMYYGDAETMTNIKKMQSEKIAAGDVGSSARRAEYNMSTTGKMGYYGYKELVNDIQNGKKLSAIPKTDLPKELQAMSVGELEIYVAKLIEKRKRLEAEISVLNQKRSEHIDAEVSKMDQEEVLNSFDDMLFETIKKQADSKEIKISGKTKR